MAKLITKDGISNEADDLRKKLYKKKKVNPNMMLPGGCHFPLLVAVQESNWTPGNLKCIQWLIERNTLIRGFLLLIGA